MNKNPLCPFCGGDTGEDGGTCSINTHVGELHQSFHAEVHFKIGNKRKRSAYICDKCQIRIHKVLLKHAIESQAFLKRIGRNAK